jgi:hypothetical protein
MKCELLLKIENDLATATKEKDKHAEAALTRVVEQTELYKNHLSADLDTTKVLKCVLLVLTAYRMSLPQCKGESIAHVTANIAVLEPYLIA